MKNKEQEQTDIENPIENNLQETEKNIASIPIENEIISGQVVEDNPAEITEKPKAARTRKKIKSSGPVTEKNIEGDDDSEDSEDNVTKPLTTISDEDDIENRNEID